MGQVLPRSATTTEAIRRAIQHSQESMRSLARRHGINPKTVAKWKKRESTVVRRTCPTVPRSTVLTVEQEAIIVAFRKHTLLPLDDCLYALQATIPQLARRQALQEKVQHLSDRLLPHRPGRGQDRSRQALLVRSHRPYIEVGRRGAGRTSRYASSCRVP
jgi:transposase-like protein